MHMYSSNLNAGMGAKKYYALNLVLVLTCICGLGLKFLSLLKFHPSVK